jgi:hypothetical protein
MLKIRLTGPNAGYMARLSVEKAISDLAKFIGLTLPRSWNSDQL